MLQWKWKFFLEEAGWRCKDEDTEIEFGDAFQEVVRSPEWKSAVIVHEKYKRKYNLEHKDLIELTKFVEKFSEERQSQGKKCSNDFLTQIASAEIKKKFTKKCVTNIQNIKR